MTAFRHPAFILFLTALFLPLVRGRVRSAFWVLGPLAGVLAAFTLTGQERLSFSVWEATLELFRPAAESRLFGLVFSEARFDSRF